MRGDDIIPRVVGRDDHFIGAFGDLQRPVIALTGYPVFPVGQKLIDGKKFGNIFFQCQRVQIDELGVWLSHIADMPRLIGDAGDRGFSVRIADDQSVLPAFPIDKAPRFALNEGAARISDEDVAYMTGLQIGHMVSKQWVEGFNQQIFGNDSTQSLSRENLLAGFVAGIVDKGYMTKLAAQTYMQQKMEEVTERSLEKRYADVIAEGKKFLEENKTKEGVMTTESGLQYKILTKGTGEIPADTNFVKVNYKGTLIDGTEFDSSYKRKDKNGKSQPTTFRADRVIKGWTEALTMMPVGSKWELYIPYNLAYGSRSMGAKIKPFSTLIFEVELVGIDKKK